MELKEYEDRDIDKSEASEIAGKLRGRYRDELTEDNIKVLNLVGECSTV